LRIGLRSVSAHSAEWEFYPAEGDATDISDSSGELRRLVGPLLHLFLASQNGTPLFVLGHGHAALDTDAHALLWRLVSTQQSFQK
jgi:hypothetical protein